MSDPEMLADLIASTFVSGATRRQQLLEELDLNQRLRLLIQYLREENGAPPNVIRRSEGSVLSYGAPFRNRIPSDSARVDDL